MLADADATASTRSSARSPTSPTRRCCTPTRALLPRRRRAWASWNYHLLAEPTGRTTVTYHMNRLQSLDADREFCVTLNRTRGDRPGAGDPHDPLRAPGLHAPTGVARAGAPRARSAARNRTHYCGAYWGWGFHEDGVVSALRVARALRGAAVSASAIYEGTIRHRRFAEREREFSHRIALAYVDLDELPGCSAGAWSPAPGLVRFRRSRLPGRPGVPLHAPCATRSSATGAGPTGPIRLLTQLRSFGHCFNPVSFYYCFDARRARCGALVAEVTNTPWGERHAYVLARRRGRVLRGESTRRCTSRRSWAWTSATTCARPRPARRCRCTSRAARRRSCAFDATLDAAPPRR